MDIKINKFNAYTAFGLGVFETIPYLYGRIPLLNEHLLRLKQGLFQLNQSVPIVSTQVIWKNAKQLGDTKGVIRLIARLDASVELHISENFPYTDEDYIKGFKLTMAKGKKNENSPYVTIKSLNYLENYLERQSAKSLDFSDALFENTKGEICETSSANIFILSKNKLLTPPINAGILAGILRGEIFKFAKQQAVTVIEMPLYKQDILAAEHVFVTNSLLGIMPVVELDEIKLAFNTRFHKTFCKTFMQEYMENRKF